jgi:hypothetical protein
LLLFFSFSCTSYFSFLLSLPLLAPPLFPHLAFFFFFWYFT